MDETCHHKIFRKVLIEIFILTLTWSLVQNNDQHLNLFFLQKSPEGDNEILLSITWIDKEEILENCEVYTNEFYDINDIIESNHLQVRTVFEWEMRNLLEDCTEFISRRRKRDADENELDPFTWNDDLMIDETDSTRNELESPTETSTLYEFNGLPIIFPGTKWCGAGTIAEKYDELGVYDNTDRCCRTHDYCKDSMEPGEKKGNIINTSWFTRLSCECDKAFYNCLTEVNSTESNTLLKLYFNILQRECFILDYPLTNNCKSYLTFLKIICWEYERNTTAPKEYQWTTARQLLQVSLNGPLTAIIPP